MMMVETDAGAPPAARAMSPRRGESEPEARQRATSPVIRFPQGLPGFPGATQFALSPLEGGGGLLVLRSLERPGLRFIVTPHDPRMLPLAEADREAACEALGMAPEQVTLLLVLTVRGHPGQLELHVNLRAPIFLDAARCIAVQHVLASSAYPVRCRLGVADAA
jgi:flagellar assembly factor FliW